MSENAVSPHVEGLLHRVDHLIRTRDFASRLLAISGEEEQRHAIAEFAGTLPGPVSMEEGHNVLLQFNLSLRDHVDLTTLFQLCSSLIDNLETPSGLSLSSAPSTQTATAIEQSAPLIQTMNDLVQSFEGDIPRGRLRSIIRECTADIHVSRGLYDIMVEHFRLLLVDRFEDIQVHAVLEIMFEVLPEAAEQGLVRAVHLS